MNKLASLTGYTPGSAGFTMGKIKRKLKNKTAGISTDNPTPKKSQGRPRTKSTPNSKKPGTSKRAATTEEDDEDNVEETPSKRTKKGAAKNTRNEPSDDEEEYTNPTIKKEELNDIQTGADDFYTQASRYAFEEDID